jgi:hypothetical protein
MPANQLNTNQNNSRLAVDIPPVAAAPNVTSPTASNDNTARSSSAIPNRQQPALQQQMNIVQPRRNGSAIKVNANQKGNPILKV